MNGNIAWLDETRYKFGMGKGNRMRADLSRVVHRFAELIETRIKSSMAAPKSGRMYTGPGGKVYQASAPGEAPAIVTGRLLNAVQTKIYGFGMEAEIGVFAGGPPYAQELEQGLSGFQARPYVVPAFKEYEFAFLKSIERVVSYSGVI